MLTSIIILFFLLIENINAQDENVLSYYAVGNSLDGQPLIDSRNVLRFFPVFKMRDEIVAVKITVYVGSLIYKREAVKTDDGSYWEANLPEFHLGEAIQRLEVETKLKRDKSELIKFEDMKKELNVKFDNIKDTMKTIVTNIENSLIRVDNQLVSKLNNLAIKKDNLDEIKTEANNVSGKLDSLKLIVKENNTNEKNKFINKLEEIDTIFRRIDSSLNTLYNTENITISSINEIREKIQILIEDKFADDLITIINRMTETYLDINKKEDELKKQIIAETEQVYVDSNLVGPKVQKSDIVIEDKFIRMLYRNYKPGLRQMPALDPAEKLGIFRIRYVPFPVVGNKLYRPFAKNSLTVFEIGLGFGNVTIPGDEFVKPTLSIDRLGVAVALTEELFSNDAEILALAITYDFNIYGSIGVGVNFRNPEENEKVSSYFSFGINKKAFEFLIANISKVFAKL